MNKLTLRDLEVRGQRVLVRVDFNVPTEEREGKFAITDDTRIRESLPTINYLREQGARTILMAHFGRPKGKRVEKYSLRPVGDYLHTLIDHGVAFSHDTIGKIPEEIIAHMTEGDVTLLENVRFHPGEEKNDPAFAKSLAGLGDLYVNDAFGAAHRAHASTAGITKFVKRSAMGFLMEKEIQYLSHELAKPALPAETRAASRRRMESRMAGRPWISGAPRLVCTRTKSPEQKRFCGMARWAFSKFRHSLQEPSRLRKLSRA